MGCSIGLLLRYRVAMASRNLIDRAGVALAERDLTHILMEKAVEDETIRTSATADFSSLVGFIKFR